MKPPVWIYLESVDAGTIAARFREWRDQQPDIGILAPSYRD
jgi:hypothetical protein